MRNDTRWNSLEGINSDLIALSHEELEQVRAEGVPKAATGYVRFVIGRGCLMNLFFSLLYRLFPRQAHHYELMRRACDAVGCEVEAWDYDRFIRTTEEIALARTVDGVDVLFNIEVVDRNRNGALYVCIDTSASVAVFPFPLPSYVFWKHADGSISYW